MLLRHRKTRCVFPETALVALQWCAIADLLLHALPAKSLLRLSAPLLRRKLRLEMHEVASVASRAWHELFFYSFPIYLLAPQVLQEQRWSPRYFALEDFVLKRPVDQKVFASLYARQRHVTRNDIRTGAGVEPPV